MKELLGKIRHIFDDCFQLLVRKNVDYGNSWASLGSRGNFVMIKRKCDRLENLVWKNNQQAVSEEAIRDTYLDLINYAVFGILLSEIEQKGEQSES